MDCNLRPNISSSAGVEKVGFDVWHAWRSAWWNERLEQLDGVECVTDIITIRKVSTPAPSALRITTMRGMLALLARFGHHSLARDLERALNIGKRMLDVSVPVEPGTLRTVCRLADPDVDVLLNAVSWLKEHKDLGGWTQRQLPVPGMHTKWLAKHENLVRRLVGRDISAEAKPRPAIAHFTYADPIYRSSGRRHHDAWTSGDAQVLPYAPRHVIIVENRDCRLWFPTFEDTVIVEGEGKAAALLAEIEWVVEAERIIYWGDLDADGFAILSLLRRTLEHRGATVESLLMDGMAWRKYKHLGVSRDKTGELLQPSRTWLSHLTPDEADCYSLLATDGDVDVRRIEQERIPIADVEAQLRNLLVRPTSRMGTVRD